LNVVCLTGGAAVVSALYAGLFANEQSSIKWAMFSAEIRTIAGQLESQYETASPVQLL